MLDLIITYVNFIILSIGYIVKKFTFFPPDPPHYKSVPTENEDEEDILFLIHQKKKKGQYIGIEFHFLDYRFIKIIDKENNSLPLLLFHPPAYIPVCIIYSHGNSGDLGSCLLEYYDIAIHTNCMVVSFEYPGYGECKNQPMTESNFYKNLKMTYYFVKKILGFKSHQIILYGFSLGTGIMFEIACKKEYSAAGLILQSPFLSIVRTLYNIKTTKYFDLFNSCDKAKNLCIKTFFIHGNKDNIIPYIHGRILAKLIPQKYYYDFLTVKNAGHNNIFKNNKDLIYKRIRQFIKDRTGKSSDFSINTEIKEKPPLENIEIKEINKKKEKDFINTSCNKLNKSDEIKSPSINLIVNTHSNLNEKSFLKNKMNMLINNKYYTNNLFKYPYPNNINNNYRLQSQNIVFPFSNTNSQIYQIYNPNPNKYINNIYSNLNKSNIVSNNGLFNSNIVIDNYNNNFLNTKYTNNSTFISFNNPK